MAKKSKSVRLLAPVSLNLEELIKNADFHFLINFNKNEKKRRIINNLPISRQLNDFICNFDADKEKQKWLKPVRLKKLYWIITKIGNKRINDPFCLDDFVKLHSSFLQKNLGTRYANQALLILEKLDVIMPSRFKYLAGARSRAFKLCAPYLGQKRHVIKAFDFEQKVDGEGFDDLPTEKVSGVKTSFHQHLLDSLKSVTVSPKAYEHLESLRFEKDTGQVALKRLEAIKKQLLFFVVDKFGRVTSNVTSLTHSKKDADDKKLGLRRFLLLDGEPVIETDIHASHPFHCLDLYQLAEAKEEAVKAEKQRYAALFQNDFYVAIQELSGLDLTKDALKSFWLSEILNRPRPKSAKGKAILTAFELKFPIMVDCLKKVRAKSYIDISHRLLRLESTLLIHTVGQQIWEKTGAKFLTVHDSILHKRQDTKLVQKTINAVYREQLGFAPKLRCNG